MKKTTIMQILMMLLLVNGFIPANATVTNRVEIMKDCPKCLGTGSIKTYKTCSTCGGKGSIRVIRGRLVRNESRCPTCSMSTRLGKVKVSDTCSRCDGCGKIRTGKFEDKIEYTEEEQKAIDLAKEKAKRKAIIEYNKRIIAQQNRTNRINTLRCIKVEAETEWKKLLMKDNTPENFQRKLDLRAKINKCIEELKALGVQ